MKENRETERRMPNRLIHEKSPYLLQHAYNPVDWYPWGEEAFERAQKEDKPVFLSIGYSTCHWCHVMEKESFEDAEVAALLNEWFICIKVDREERPDIDSTYMQVCQMMTQRGGWPLTIVMTPDKKPFFAGTYIPKESRFGLMGLREVLSRLYEAWMNQRGHILDIVEEIVASLSVAHRPGDKDLGVSSLTTAFQELLHQFDEVHGGFGTAPKFPIPPTLFFLLRYWKRSGEEKALTMVTKTLDAMRAGGIWDHVGFGFHRYSTDSVWLVPHFEKMLYDQALLAMAYTEAHQVTGERQYREVAEHILEYVLRDMTSPEGGFYSAEDADSEGEEGKFYVWNSQELENVEHADIVSNVFDVKEEGNFTEDGIPSGRNILHMRKPLPASADELNISLESLEVLMEKARETLFEIREKRTHPEKDDKILTDWNGLMIVALSKAAQTFDKDTYCTAARKAADFIISHMLKTGLYHRYRDGEPAISGFLDDYAFFVWGLIELYETTFNPEYLKNALSLTDYMVTHFWDEEGHGFYQTSDETTVILTRQKHFSDGALPSAHAVAMLNLLRLSRMTGAVKYEEKALHISQAFSDTVVHMPMSHTFLLSALDFALGPSCEVVIVGDMHTPATHEMIQAVRKPFIPNKVVVFRPDELPGEIVSLCPFTKDLTAVQGSATGYVCRNYRCDLPAADVATLLEQLAADIE